ncbi:MAG: PTS glucitol/sorbitol transporter subunit IIA [Eubacteriales bacterium]
MKYQATITKIGEMALDFLSEDMLILFNENAPTELAEISVLHSISTLKEDVVLGDTMKICDETYIVTAVGIEALHTLKIMGHCCLKFDGATTPQLPGTIHLLGSKIPDIVIGKNITIE